MSRTMFLILWIVIAGGLLTFMALAWRARKRRDAELALPELGLDGDEIASFPHVGYVSTTPIGEPLVRVAIPGLSFKGWADVIVRNDGVEIAVQGERPVEIAAAQLRGTGSASGRVGKTVERDGLALLQWQSQSSGTRELESSFRFSSPTEQRRFVASVGKLSQQTTQTNHSSQEDA